MKNVSLVFLALVTIACHKHTKVKYADKIVEVPKVVEVPKKVEKIVEVEKPAPVVPKLLCKVYDLAGAVPSVMPNFASKTPLGTVEVEYLKNAVTNNLTPFPMLDNTPHQSLVERFGLVCEGKIKITTQGSHVFYLNSDDGTKLFVNGIQVINNDGTHAMTKKSGTVTLDQGEILIKIQYYNGNGDKGLIFTMKRPDLGFEELVKF